MRQITACLLKVTPDLPENSFKFSALWVSVNRVGQGLVCRMRWHSSIINMHVGRMRSWKFDIWENAKQSILCGVFWYYFYLCLNKRNISWLEFINMIIMANLRYWLVIFLITDKKDWRYYLCQMRWVKINNIFSHISRGWIMVWVMSKLCSQVMVE